MKYTGKVMPQQYIISFLLNSMADGQNQGLERYVFYGNLESAPTYSKIVIIKSNFFDDDIYGTIKTIPKIPFELLPQTDIPFLFGQSRLDKDEQGRFILYADIIASAYFMLSRYEEIIKPDCRDRYGRFLAKDSIVFEQGCGFRPLVDEWGLYLRNLLRNTGIILQEEKKEFKRIYLTHDIDRPFFFSFKSSIKQFIKNLIHYGNYIENPLSAYFRNDKDPYFTFPWIVNQDNQVKKIYGENIVKDIYFIITARFSKEDKYYPINSRKYKKLLKILKNNNADFGLHVSHEGGCNPKNIDKEIKLLPRWVDKENLLSRHHFLRWMEPEHINQMESAGIKEDFTLGYADSVGFRVGTCKPYYFINPVEQTVKNIIIHPLEIMERSLQESQYMSLNEDEAFNISKKIIEQVKKYNGELVILFHNSSFTDDLYFRSLYKRLLELINDNKAI